MSRNYFEILELPIATVAPAKVRRRFETRRAALLAELGNSERFEAARRDLDLLYEAYGALRNPRRQAAYRAQLSAGEPESRADRAAQLQALIEHALEGHLLRYTRRKQIVAEARRLGFSEFHTHLLIAQAQFGDRFLPTPSRDSDPERYGWTRVAARLGAAGVLGAAMFFAAVRWLAI